jgi:hypothetical protein
MKTLSTTQIGRKIWPTGKSSAEMTSVYAPHVRHGQTCPAAPNSANDYAPEFDPFFNEPIEVEQAARALASEVICRLLIWIARGRTINVRGLRASVALYCLRPDLVDGATLDELGALAGCTKQAVHKLAVSFRRTTGLS